MGSGSVSKSPDKANYVYGEKVTLTAAPAAGWAFSGWSDGASGTALSVQITINGNTTVTATFTRQCYSLAVNIDPAAGGTVQVDKAPDCGAKYTAGSVVKLTAAAKTGYTFSNWTSGVTSTANPLTVTMSGDQSVTANFILNNPAPQLTSVTPGKIQAGSEDVLLTLTGAGFMSTSEVKWEGQSLTGVVYVSATMLQVTLPKAMLADPCTGAIAVVNAGPGGGVSTPVTIEVAPTGNLNQGKLFLPFITH